MRFRTALCAFSAFLALNGCFDDSSSSGNGAPNGEKVTSLSGWAKTAVLSLPHDTNLASNLLKERWDSVVNLSKYAADARLDLGRITADWASRNPTASGWTVVEVDSTTRKTGKLYLVGFSVEGISQGGLVWVPNSNKAMPVMLYGHPSDLGIDTLSFAGFHLLLGSLDTQMVIVAPAYRGEMASLGAKSVTNDIALQSPWGRDVDDGLAFLQGTLDHFSKADPSRITAVGYSRGAGVALLSALRDSRIQSVFEIAGPTDFFATSLQNVALGLLAGKSYELPGVDYLNAQFLQPFKNGTISADSLRRVLLERSPARLALSKLLPATQAIHGLLDTTVFPDQSQALAAADSRVVYTSIQGMTHTSFLGDLSQGLTIASDLQRFLKAHLSFI